MGSNPKTRESFSLLCAILKSEGNHIYNIVKFSYSFNMVIKIKRKAVKESHSGYEKKLTTYPEFDRSYEVLSGNRPRQ